jgi:hypothetical protein
MKDHRKKGRGRRNCRGGRGSKAKRGPGSRTRRGSRARGRLRGGQEQDDEVVDDESEEEVDGVPVSIAHHHPAVLQLYRALLDAAEGSDELYAEARRLLKQVLGCKYSTNRHHCSAMASDSRKQAGQQLNRQHMKQQLAFASAFRDDPKLAEGAYLLVQLSPLGTARVDVSGNLRLEGALAECLLRLVTTIVELCRPGKHTHIGISSMSAQNSFQLDDVPSSSALTNDAGKPLTGCAAVKKAVKEVFEWFSRPLEHGEVYVGTPPLT